MSVTFIHLCKDCHQSFRSEDPKEDRCFFCTMAAEEEELTACDPDGTFDEWIEKTLEPEELDAWQRYNAEMRHTVPHFRSVWVGNKTEACKVEARCEPCLESCLSRDGCPYR